ncbi:MAG: hypothetical protein WDM81_08050 [Rhizomicrobium sp.]
MTAKHSAVRPRIQPPERSRSLSSAPGARARAEAMVLISPPTTGRASLISVQIAATAMAPAPMKRT